MILLRRILILVLLTALAGCSVPSSSPPSRGSQSPRVRCLNNPNEGDTRPMFFLFCAETP